MGKGKTGGTPTNTNGMTASVYGDAVAGGEDTFAKVDATVNMRDGPQSTVVKGTVTATAAAEGQDAFASAYTDLSVSGADKIVVKTKNKSGSGEDGSYDESVTKFKATDKDGKDGETVVIYKGKDKHDNDADVDLDGNIATVTFDAQASGQDSLVSVDAFALAVEDELSQSTVVITSVVD
ncbi:hypothetical protein KXR53_19705 [Inquilinus limosus]|uniref:hypothetical protein n=1 Tax=Inquilinus limosus TaxID=171674 RepID=UPI003F15C506